MQYGIRPVPWLVADGYIANYRDVLNSLQLILVTSNWVRETDIRDGIDPKIIAVLPVGCDTDTFVQRPSTDPKISIHRAGSGLALTQELKNSRTQEEPTVSRRGPQRSILAFLSTRVLEFTRWCCMFRMILDIILDIINRRVMFRLKQVNLTELRRDLVQILWSTASFTANPAGKFPAWRPRSLGLEFTAQVQCFPAEVP